MEMATQQHSEEEILALLSITNLYLLFQSVGARSYTILKYIYEVFQTERGLKL